MTLSQLDYFMRVGKTLSVSQAAKEMYVSQSAVSKQIILLENELGVALFNRIGNRLELSGSGQKLLSCLQRCSAEFQATYRSIQAEHVTQLSIAFTASINIGQALLEAVDVLRGSDALKLVIEALNYQERIDPESDIVITYEDVQLPLQMQSSPLFAVPKYIAYSKNDFLYGKPNLNPSDFNQHILFMGSIHRENYRLQTELCKRLKLTPQVSFCGNIASLLLSTISEHGFCIIDGLCKEINSPGLALLPIDERVQIIIACREDADPLVRGTASKIAELLRQWYEQTFRK